MIDLPYITTNNAITVYTDDHGPLTVTKTDHASSYEAAYEALSAGDEDALLSALSPARAVIRAFESVAGHHVEVDGNQLLLDGYPLDTYTARKVLQFANQKLDVMPLMRFIGRCANNPSRRAVQELYQFLEYGNMPLTPDGCFLAYKRVRDNYRDVHSGQIDNSVGSVVKMLRNEVDDRSEMTCSYGLHFCSFEYLRSFSGSRIMVLKIDPASVVSIPKDYNNTKGRCCRYAVVGEQEVPTRWEDEIVYDYDELEEEDGYENGVEVEDEEDEEATTRVQGTVATTTTGKISF